MLRSLRIRRYFLSPRQDGLIDLAATEAYRKRVATATVHILLDPSVPPLCKKLGKIGDGVLGVGIGHDKYPFVKMF